MGIRRRVQTWHGLRALAKAERLDQLYQEGFAEGYDEGFLGALADPEDEDADPDLA